MRRLTTTLVIVLILASFVLGHAARQSYKARFEPTTTKMPFGGRTAYEPGTTRSDVGSRSDIDLRPMETFSLVLRYLNQHYVEQIEESRRKDLTYGTLQNMLDSLKDPYTRFLEPKQKQLVEAAREGRFQGIGAVFGVRRITNEDGVFEQLTVVSVLPGSQAEKAGVKNGDVVAELDGKTVLSYDPLQRTRRLLKAERNGEITRDELIQQLEIEDAKIKDGIMFQKAADRLSAPFEDTCELTLLRGDKTAKVKVASAELEIEPVRHYVKDGIGYLYINLFSTSAPDKVAAALADIRKKDATGLVLDVRSNPGGSVTSAMEVARLFAPDKDFAVLSRSAEREEILKIPPARPQDNASIWTKPVVVLVDGGTASAAELLAGALRDAYGATLVGTRTFGLGLEITMLPQRDGSAVEMTTGKFFTPSGKDFHTKGLSVDTEIADPEAQLARAKALAKSG